MNSETIAISGGFDPIHPGHVELIEAAKEYGRLIIILNTDEWLIRKKGFYFQPWEDRGKLLEAYADTIIQAKDDDGTVCENLKELRPTYFGNGGDRKEGNTPELKVCKEFGITPVWNLEGAHASLHSSSIYSKKRVHRKWGYYDVLADEPGIKVKRLRLEAGGATSRQKHSGRTEYLFMPDGSVKVTSPGVWHALKAPSNEPMNVYEVQLGVCEEEDVER